MDKNSFDTALNTFPGNSIDEVREILVLKKRYPYSQVLHALAARLSKDHGLSHQSEDLQLAAVYSTDRNVLKEVMIVTSNSDIHTSTNIEIDKAATDDTREAEPHLPSVQPQIILDTVAEEVMRDLERLHELKHNFELLFIDGAANYIVEIDSSTTEKLEDIQLQKVPVEKTDFVFEEKPTLTKKQRIIALAKAANAVAQDLAQEKISSNRKKKSNSDSGENLIEEIVSTKQALNPETEKQKEQIEIIEQFIKAQPSINNKDRVPAIPSGDLTSIKSGEFGDNVVSETLVDILLQQGKKDKAVEVLKKLIWKFPQKKAYFAAQIEELKK
jgi:hypothetical protein